MQDTLPLLLNEFSIDWLSQPNFHRCAVLDFKLVIESVCEASITGSELVTEGIQYGKVHIVDAVCVCSQGFWLNIAAVIE